MPYLILFILLISCDTTPATEQDDYKQTDEEVSEEISPDALASVNNKAAILAMANLQNKEDEDFSGKAYFTMHEDVFTLTLILNNADRGIYPVYLMKEASCDNPVIPGPQDIQEDDHVGNIGSIEVVVDGTGRNEITLREFENNPSEKITDYKILIVENDGGIVGCGDIKKYIE